MFRSIKQRHLTCLQYTSNSGVVQFFHPRSSCTKTHISADVQRITLNASCMMISGGRTNQLDIFSHVTGFTSDFLSFIVVELIQFFHRAIQMYFTLHYICKVWPIHSIDIGTMCHQQLNHILMSWVCSIEQWSPSFLIPCFDVCTLLRCNTKYRHNYYSNIKVISFMASQATILIKFPSSITYLIFM